MITQAETTVFDLCCNLVLGYITRHFRFMQSAKNYLSDVPVIYILISSRLKMKKCACVCVLRRSPAHQTHSFGRVLTFLIGPFQLSD